MNATQAKEIVEGFVGGGFVPAFVTQPRHQVGGLAGISPGLQDELDRLVQKIKRRDAKRKKRQALLDKDRVGKIVAAVLAARASMIVHGD